MEEKSQFRDYSNVTICNESVQEIKRLIESKSKDENGVFAAYYYEYEVITHLLKEIYELKQRIDQSIRMNKSVAKERNDLKDELWHLKYGKQ